MTDALRDSQPWVRPILCSPAHLTHTQGTKDIFAPSSDIAFLWIDTLSLCSLQAPEKSIWVSEIRERYENTPWQIAMDIYSLRNTQLWNRLGAIGQRSTQIYLLIHIPSPTAVQSVYAIEPFLGSQSFESVKGMFPVHSVQEGLDRVRAVVARRGGDEIVEETMLEVHGLCYCFLKGSHKQTRPFIALDSCLEHVTHPFGFQCFGLFVLPFPFTVRVFPLSF